MTDPAVWKRLDALHHDREADRYDDLIGREFAPYQHTHAARPWAATLAADGARVVLDIGCGTGRTTLPVAAAGPAVIAADMSRGMLARTRAKARAAGLDRVWLLVADAEHLPLASACVDGVVCQGVLHHLPDVAGALAEADRVLRPGGRLFLAEPSSGESLPNRLVRAFAAAARPLAGLVAGRRSPAAAHERPLRSEALLAPLTARGYEVSTSHLVHLPFVYRVLPAGLSRRLAAWVNRAEDRGPRDTDIFIARARKPSDRRPPALG